ncbi:MAG: HD domain-containing protein, partial [Actinobacteria bacterium]
RTTTAAGRACATRRPVLVPGERHAGGHGTLAIPLVLNGRVLGVIEMRLAGDVLGMDPDVQRRLDRFATLLATILERRRAKEQADRRVASYAELDGVSSALARFTEIDRIEEFVLSVLGKSFESEVAGIAVTSWGRDRAAFVVGGRVTQVELDAVLSEALGRDIAREPLETMRQVTLGEVVLDHVVRDDLKVLAVPIEAGDFVVGYLFLAGADGIKFDSEDEALLERIAAHSGAALERSALFGRIRDDYAKTIAALSATLDAGERVDRGHAHRVMDYSLMVAEELGLKLEDYEQLRFAGLLHDIGKTGLPQEILLKPSKLSPAEVLEMQRHAEMGATIVEQIDFLNSLTPIILHHHERWDGKGYPMGLVGNEIPMLARVLAVADAFDAMTSSRPFRAALSVAAARREIEAGAGTQFDPRMVAALLEALDRQALAGATG